MVGILLSEYTELTKCFDDSLHAPVRDSTDHSEGCRKHFILMTARHQHLTKIFFLSLRQKKTHGVADGTGLMNAWETTGDSPS